MFQKSSKKWRKSKNLILSLFLCLLFFIYQSTCFSNTTFVCAHRGDVKNAPENTLPAFQSAVKKGVHMIEFDVRMTKDGHLVLMHDATVDRTTNGKGKVSDLTIDEINKLDAGAWFGKKFEGTKVPSLAETVSNIPYGILLNVHVYGDEFVTMVVTRTLKELEQLGRCIIACNDEKQVETVRKEAKNAKVCLLQGAFESRKDFIDRAIQLKVEFIQIHFAQGLTGLQEDVEKAHQHNIKVNFFSAQDRETIKSLAQANIDYILTDDIDLCFEVLKEFGTKPLEINLLEKKEILINIIPSISYISNWAKILL